MACVSIERSSSGEPEYSPLLEHNRIGRKGKKDVRVPNLAKAYRGRGFV